MATILVVDDAAFMRMRMSKILSEAGYDVIQAESGREAVELCSRHGFAYYLAMANVLTG